MRTPRTIRSVGYVTTGLVLGKLAGFFKHFVIVKYFGPTYDADIFFVANTISDLTINIVVSGLLAGAFIPVASEVLVKYGRKRFSEFVTLAFFTTGSILFVGALAIFFFSHKIGLVIAPGYVEEQHLMISRILKILAPGIMFIGFGAVLRGIMQVKENFFLPSLGLFVANLTTIVFTVLFHKEYGIIAPSVGTTLGFALWCAILLPPTYKWLKIGAMTNLVREYLRRFVKYSVPVIGVMFFSNIIFVIEKAIASAYYEGAISYLNLAFRLSHVCSSVLVIPLSVVLLPKLSKHFGKSDFPVMHGLANRALSLAAILLFPSLTLIVLNSGLASTIAYGLTGVSADSINVIAGYFVVYSFAYLGIFFYPTLLMLMYSLQEANQLVIANMLGVLAYLATVFALGDSLESNALPIAFCAWAISTTAYIFVYLRLKVFMSNPPLLEKFPLLSGAILLWSALIAKLYLPVGNGLVLVVTGVLVSGYLFALKQKGFLNVIFLKKTE